MNERLLQFIWQNKLFDFSGLKTVHDEKLDITRVGVLNTYDGPDFYDAHITIANLKWVGTVEIHCKDTEWLQHGHQNDERYGSVILHVVWEVANTVTVPEGVPCLVLKNYVTPEFLSRYQNLMESGGTIPCYSQISSVEEVYKFDALENARYLRLQRKAGELKGILEEFNTDWQQVMFFLMAKALGKKANKEIMSDFARRLPLKHLLKHSDSELAIESMIFGVAGFLETPVDEYSSVLAKEFFFYKKKYGFKNLSVLQWNNSKVRGLSRPMLALAFLATLVPRLGELIGVDSSHSFLKEMHLSSYWTKHHGFGKESKSKNTVSMSLLEHLTINAVVPFLSLKGVYYGEHVYFDKAEVILSGCKKESNTIISKLEQTGFKVQDASSSQGAIELFNEYCMQKRCLDCRVGARILGRV